MRINDILRFDSVGDLHYTRVIIFYIFISDFIQKLLDPKSIGPSRCLRCCCVCYFFLSLFVREKNFIAHLSVSWLAKFSLHPHARIANANAMHILYHYSFTMRRGLPVCNLISIEVRLKTTETTEFRTKSLINIHVSRASNKNDMFY